MERTCRQGAGSTAIRNAASDPYEFWWNSMDEPAAPRGKARIRRAQKFGKVAAQVRPRRREWVSTPFVSGQTSAGVIRKEGRIDPGGQTRRPPSLAWNASRRRVRPHHRDRRRYHPILTSRRRSRTAGAKSRSSGWTAAGGSRCVSTTSRECAREPGHHGNRGSEINRSGLAHEDSSSPATTAIDDWMYHVPGHALP